MNWIKKNYEKFDLAFEIINKIFQILKVEIIDKLVKNEGSGIS